MAQGRTVVLVAHRPALLELADRVVHLQARPVVALAMRAMLTASRPGGTAAAAGDAAGGRCDGVRDRPDRHLGVADLALLAASGAVGGGRRDRRRAVLRARHAGCFATANGWSATTRPSRVLARLRVRVYERIEPLAPAGLRAFRSGDLLARLVGDVDSIQDLLLRVIAAVRDRGGGRSAGRGAGGRDAPHRRARAAGRAAPRDRRRAVACRAPVGRTAARQAGARGELSESVVELLDGAPELTVHGAIGLAARPGSCGRRGARPAGVLERADGRGRPGSRRALLSGVGDVGLPGPWCRRRRAPATLNGVLLAGARAGAAGGLRTDQPAADRDADAAGSTPLRRTVVEVLEARPAGGRARASAAARLRPGRRSRCGACAPATPGGRAGRSTAWTSTWSRGRGRADRAAAGRASRRSAWALVRIPALPRVGRARRRRDRRPAGRGGAAVSSGSWPRTRTCSTRRSRRTCAWPAGTPARAELLEVLERVRLLEWVQGLPDGLATEVGERGGASPLASAAAWRSPGACWRSSPC